MIEVPAAARAGQNAELALRSCIAAPLASFAWRQTIGPTVAGFLGRRSAAISIELPDAGRYGFEVRYTDENGIVRTANASFEAAASAAASSGSVVVRGDPLAWSHRSLSARAWLVGVSSADQASALITWTQLSGATLTLSTPQDFAQVFTAPLVAADELVKLRATAVLTNGQRLTGDYTVLIQPPPRYPSSQALWGGGVPVSAMFAYRAASPYAQALEKCVYNAAQSFNELCPLRQLPLLGAQTRGQAPTVDQVMDRVLVSHEWMGEVFERYLREQDPSGDLRRQLASTTAVVIGARLRPSFYWVATGAIYVDAANLWLTPEQRDTVSELPDLRAAYGLDLAHTSLWRYVKDNQAILVNPPISQRSNRPLESLHGSLTRILYHELTHAADFTPPYRHLVMDPDAPVIQGAYTYGTERLQSIPLRSAEISGIANVRFLGVASTAAQRAFTPEQVGDLFAQDVGNDFYSFVKLSTAYPYEDTAMLVEEALMQLRQGVWRDVAVTQPILPGQNANPVIVRWGQRGRVGDERIRARAQIAFNELMPWLDADFAQGLGAPIPMRVGASWQENLNPSAAVSMPAQTTGQLRWQDAMATSAEVAGHNTQDAERIAHLRHLEQQTQLVMHFQRR